MLQFVMQHTGCPGREVNPAIDDSLRHDFSPRLQLRAAAIGLLRLRFSSIMTST